MVILIVAALILGAPFLIGAYFKLAAKSERRAVEAWHSVERYAHVLLEDRRLSSPVGDMVEAVVQHVGDGRLTRSMLFAVLVRRKRQPKPGASDALTSLNSEQESQLFHFLLAALFYDSLTTPLPGVVLRQLLYWLAATAADRSAPVSRVQVEPVMSAAGRMCAVG